MLTVTFNQQQCVKIENQEQFDAVYHVMRGSDMPLKEWLNTCGGYPKFPIYLEYANSAYRGMSIGFTHSPINTWTKQPYEVLSFEQATRYEVLFDPAQTN